LKSTNIMKDKNITLVVGSFISKDISREVLQEMLLNYYTDIGRQVYNIVKNIRDDIKIKCEITIIVD